MLNKEIIQKAKAKFFYKSLSPYYYGLKNINSEKIIYTTQEKFLSAYRLQFFANYKNGDLVCFDDLKITVKCFYNKNNDVLLVVIK
jgi:hypothetical protein